MLDRLAALLDRFPVVASIDAADASDATALWPVRDRRANALAAA